MKPLIGILSDFSDDDRIGMSTKLGFRGQHWQLLANDYVMAVELGGGIPVIIPILQNQDDIPALLQNFDGLLLSGGQDIDPQYFNELPIKGLGQVNPLRDSHEIALVKHALEHMDIPILGICRGLQLLNVAAKGSLYQDLSEQRPSDLHHTNWNFPKHHPVFKANVRSKTHLSNAFKISSLPINSFNHQGIKELASNFIISMTAPDGLIEGIELDSGRWVCAVQWHPEMMLEHSPKYLRLFNNFVSACQKK